VAAAAQAAPSVTRKANGAMSAVLSESYLSYSVARIADDGSVKLECVEGKAHAEAARKATAAVPGVDRHEK
jgi:hypothetical protein